MVLNAFDTALPSVGVSELARTVGLPKSTVHRILGELQEWGMVIQNEDGRYEIGSRMFEIGSRLVTRSRLRDLALPALHALYQACGETIHLAVLDGRRSCLYLEKIPGTQPLKLPSRLGGRVAAHCTAVGKVLLAFSPPEVLQDYLRVPLERLGPRSITDPALLIADLEVVRQQGFATSEDEVAPNVNGVGAPILYGDIPVAAVAVSGTAQNVKPERFVLAAKTAAAAVEKALAKEPAYTRHHL